MKSIVLVILLMFSYKSFSEDAAKFFISKSIKTTIFSEAPLENIEATSRTGVAILNTETREIQFNIPIRSFDFAKKKMQEHFNENYMESDKHPNARFKGKINQAIDLSVSGNYNVSVTGDLEVHGVKQKRTISGSIKVAPGSVAISSKFDVRCADHNISIPRLVFRNIAETIRVTVSGSFTPYNPTQS
ncbi:MAG TPA: YceI family protein [Sphingobacteriaceae bacterium]